MVTILILLICVLQSVYGILQYCKIFNNYSRFDVVGSFDNPSGFAACLSASFPYCFSLFHKKRPFYLITGFVILIIMAIAIILSGSRSGILSVLVISLLYWGYNSLFICNKFWKRVWLWGGIGGLAIICVILFILKKDSAVGRLLIWYNTIALIKDSPIFGFGPSGFNKNYMNKQAYYFENNSESIYSQLADNIMLPFNDYLLITVKYGMIGLLILFVVLYFAFKKSIKLNPGHFCILSIGVFACFSYPLRYPYILFLLSYSIAITSKKVGYSNLNIIVKKLLVGGFIVGIYMLCKDICFETKWNKLAKLSVLGKTEHLISEYNELYKTWNYNPLFLYNYAAILNKASKFQLSNNVIKVYRKYIDDYDIRILLANNYYNLGKFELAEKSYIKANHMCPNRFIPLYGQFLINKKRGDLRRSMDLSYMILNKPIKSMSRTIYYIQIEVSKYIKTQNSNNRIINDKE